MKIIDLLPDELFIFKNDKKSKIFKLVRFEYEKAECFLHGDQSRKKVLFKKSSKLEIIKVKG